MTDELNDRYAAPLPGESPPAAVPVALPNVPPPAPGQLNSVMLDETPDRKWYTKKRWLLPVGAVGFISFGAAVSDGDTSDDAPEELAFVETTAASTMSDALAAHIDTLDYDVDILGTADAPRWRTTFIVVAPEGSWNDLDKEDRNCEIEGEDSLKLKNEDGLDLVLRDGTSRAVAAEISFEKSSVVDGQCSVSATASGSPEELTNELILENQSLTARLDGQQFFKGQSGSRSVGEGFELKLSQVPEPVTTTTAPEETTTSEPETAIATTVAPTPAPAPPPTPAPAPAPTPAPAPAPTAAPAPPPVVAETASFANCTEARQAGRAPVRRGDPGYGSHLDRDGDGVGCE